MKHNIFERSGGFATGSDCQALEQSSRGESTCVRGPPICRRSFGKVSGAMATSKRADCRRASWVPSRVCLSLHATWCGVQLSPNWTSDCPMGCQTMLLGGDAPRIAASASGLAQNHVRDVSPRARSRRRDSTYRCRNTSRPTMAHQMNSTASIRRCQRPVRTRESKELPRTASKHRAPALVSSE